jgi:hypothetical protein
VTGLSEFLLARIAEDEAVARSAPDRDPRYADSSMAYLAWDVANEPTGEIALSKTRVLAECEAKRRIVEMQQGAAKATIDLAPTDEPIADAIAGSMLVTATAVLKLLALPYADHPDYLEEWRP